MLAEILKRGGKVGNKVYSLISSTLDDIEIAQKQLKAAQKELIQLEREFQAKQTSRGYDLCWAVACEVHN